MRPRVEKMAATRATWALCALALLAILHDTDATDDMSPMPFLLNVRYGRSPPDHPDHRRHLEPRTDRFFMGSRYGKRSPRPQLESVGQTDLVCEYTGVMAFYHCYTTQQTHRRREEDPRSVREER